MLQPLASGLVSLSLALGGAAGATAPKKAKRKSAPPAATKPAADSSKEPAKAPAADPASATGDRGRTAVLPLEVTGEVRKHVRGSLTTRLREGLSTSEFSVADDAQVAKAAGKKCNDPGCYKRVADATQAKWVVRTTVAVSGADMRYGIELIDGTDGTVVAVAQDTCEICSENEAAQTMGGLAASLGRKLEIATRSQPILIVRSEPTGARVLLDGKDVGVTPLRLPATAGDHTVEVLKAKRLSQELEVTLVPGVEESLDVELQKDPDAKAPIPAWAGWTALGVGIAGAGAGIALLVIDGREVLDDCSGGNVDPEGDCRFVRETKGGGAALTAIGGALIATGIALLVVRSQRAEPRPKKDRKKTAWQRVQVQPQLGGLRISF